MILTVLMVAGLSGACNAQTSFTVAQTVKLGNIDQLSQQLDGAVVYKTTKGTRMTIEQKIVIEHPSRSKELAMAKFLEDSGHYDYTVITSSLDRTVQLVSPQVPYITIDGKIVDVKISYVVYLPEHVKIGATMLVSNK